MRSLGFVSILITGLIAFAPLAAAETTSEFTIEFSDPFHATVNMVQTWSGEEATAFRTELERTFGNQDGDLNETEVQRIRNSTLLDMEGQWHPRMRLDGNPAHVTDVVLDFSGLMGSVSANTPVRIVHDFQVEFNETEAENHTFNTTVGVGSFAQEGNVTVMVPEGWEITNASGFMQEPDIQDRTATGDVAFNENVQVQFSETQAAGGLDTATPGIGPLAIGAAGICVALLAGRRRR